MDIKKLSNDNVFGAIKTGITDIKEMPMIIRKTYNSWMNKMGLKEKNMLWIAADPYAIINLINTSPLKITSKRIHFESLANILLAIDKNKFKNFVKNLYTVGIVIQQNVPQGENELTEAESKTYVPYEEIVAVRNSIHSNLSLKNNMEHLILSLNTYIPPVRLDYLGMIVKYSNDEPELEEDTAPAYSTNYLWINEDNDKMYIVLNKDKIGNGILELKDFVSKHSHLLYINGDKLKEIIKDSLEQFPREYLLCSPKDEVIPMGMPTYNSLINQSLHKKAKQNIFRKAYINYWHDSMRLLNHNELKTIAMYMRHSLSTAMSTYKKIIVAPPNSPYEAQV